MAVQRFIGSLSNAYFNAVHQKVLASSPLSGRVFWDAEDLDWLIELEKNHHIISDELADFKNASKRNIDKEDLFPGMTSSFGTQPWELLHLMVYGYKIEAIAKHFPKTLALVSRIVPEYCSVTFSTIPSERKDIPEHSDDRNGTLRIHLGLTTPQDGENFISVSGQKRSWQQGKAFVADVTQPHWVRKTSENERTIIIVDFVRPTSKALKWLGYRQFARTKGRKVAQVLNRQYRQILTTVDMN
ncbi:hypothetical protein PSECIP111951_00164 [Pseudoalteromonas holothuriae]|uniref:Aspartyl/asparaginy/proline hydroxylase domain-containing protein n=1 Tax=Pseudoalteromonas holothuriae TaxID=2963714 RepID=A0A9W4QTH2_9GAMM|nr:MULTISPECIES: aspartyl/asparaginyl beta-hydroxylase domain-containing protein [unclassified Pseudoalteromonas]CAH9050299.1 hypothetical protein PSECIP111951_00164 [Pseudoalteromonas sp. CIP111951]CAH9052370.1 hypothetical protein PSECIP111854_00955 [Pseudoalteromonas sp. CIP111854]